MKRRLLFTLILCLVAAILLTAWIGLVCGRQAYRRATEHFLSTAINLVRQSWQEGEDLASLDARIRAAMDAEGKGLRLTVMNEDGSILFDSAADTGEMENHLARPEVKAIYRGAELGVDVRHSKSLNIDYIYLAKADSTHKAIIRCAVPLRTEAEIWRYYSRQILLAALVSLIISLIVFTKLLKRYLDPLEDLGKQADALACGNLTARMKEDEATSAELKRIAIAFNHMADEIEASTRRLTRNTTWLDAILQSLQEPLLAVDRQAQVVFANRFALELFRRGVDPRENPFPLILLTRDESLDKLCQEVIERGSTLRRELSLPSQEGRKPYQLLISPLDEDACLLLFHDLTLEMEARLLRSSFVANVTHELKTPLTSIRGFVETLRSDSQLPPEQQQRFLGIIAAETQRLSNLIQDVLQLSKLEEKGGDSCAETFDLNALIDELIVSLDERAVREGITLIGEDEPQILPVTADREQVKELLRNLLDNGIKYNRRGGRLSVRAERSAPDKVRIAVEDNGEGIEAQALPRIFERFYRVPRGDSDKAIEGTGLGLAIVKHIALRYGGDVEVFSRKGDGSCFVVELKI